MLSCILITVRDFFACRASHRPRHSHSQVAELTVLPSMSVSPARQYSDTILAIQASVGTQCSAPTGSHHSNINCVAFSSTQWRTIPIISSATVITIGHSACCTIVLASSPAALPVIALQTCCPFTMNLLPYPMATRSTLVA